MTEGIRPPGRPWWVPLLGVGSIGLGGLQGLGGLALLWLGMQMKGSAAGVFFLLGGAWLLPGVALAAGGVGIVSGARWGRWLSVGAVAMGVGALSLVAERRTTIPPAVADAIEFASAHPEAKGALADTLVRLRKDKSGDPVVILRDPGQADVQGWAYAVYCGCPVLPWYALLLLACVPTWGRRLA